MLPDGSIHARQLWKRFRADRQRSSVQDELVRLRARLRGDPSAGWRWVLRDINLDITPGEAVALIGSNGSGKSTLLKVFSRVMFPYAGELEVKGRVGALIEIRAGIHPDLTGRENIYLFGALLGLGRKRVMQHFDEIVSFAELEGSVERMVKFYSSGMVMRLAFAVAAYLDPDILLVDEVLAVGDAAFQQRCLDRIRQLLQEGTTLVLVSHDLAAIEAVCKRGLWLNDGLIASDGPVRDTLADYRHFIEENAAALDSVEGEIRLVKVDVRGEDDGDGAVLSGDTLGLRLVLESADGHEAQLCLGVSEGPSMPVFALQQGVSIGPGQSEVRCSIERLPLPRGRFYLWAGVWKRGREMLPWQPAAYFDVEGPNLERLPLGIVRLSPVRVDATWDVSQ